MSPEFWTLIGIVILQLAGMYNNYQTRRAEKPLTTAQSDSVMGDALEKLGQEYSRALTTIKAQDEELHVLRPVLVEIATVKQQTTQAIKDKGDWKHYAEKLRQQLEEHEILPIPFRRYPSNGDSDKMKAITQAQVEAAKESKHVQ